MLRAGGYFAWAAQPVYKHEAVLEEQWEEMVNLTTRLFWTLVKKEGYIAIWQKPLNTSCYLSREEGTQPPLCEPDDNPDNVWCEPFDTYPRTYDLIHAAGLFSVEKSQQRCNISTIMLEMDRILRPGGKVYIRDILSIMDELQSLL